MSGVATKGGARKGGAGKTSIGGRASSVGGPKPGSYAGERPKVSPAVGRRRLVLLITAVLYLFGLVMVTSATSGTSLLNNGDQWEYLRKQLIIGGLGCVAMAIAMHIPLGLLRRLTLPLLIASTALLLVVFVPGVGHSANGATRWIYLGGGFQLQPSEIVKLALVIYLADHLARTPAPRHWWRDFLKSPGGVALVLAAIIFIQRDLGSAMVTGALVLVLYMLSGTNWRLLAGTVGPGIALVSIGILSEEYRRERFLAFLDPWADPHGPGYQLVQALIAIGSGGPFGVGLGHSVQKIHFLPEAHTDMIFSIVAEELGLVGVLVVLVAFAALAIVGVRIALRASDRFTSLVAAGLTFILCGQATLNLAGVVGVLPLTGVPLPLVSYGGSNLLVSLTALGLLANIAVAQHEQYDADGPAVASGPADSAGRSRWYRRAPGASAGSS